MWTESILLLLLQTRPALPGRTIPPPGNWPMASTRLWTVSCFVFYITLTCLYLCLIEHTILLGGVHNNFNSLWSIQSARFLIPTSHSKWLSYIILYYIINFSINATLQAGPDTIYIDIASQTIQHGCLSLYHPLSNSRIICFPVVLFITWWVVFSCHALRCSPCYTL